MTTGKLAGNRRAGLVANLTCLGFDRVERSYQPRLIALSIVPGHFKDLDGSYPTTEHPANGSPSQSLTALLKRENMVKPHGSLVPVSLTYRYASTPGLSTWSSTRSLQRDYSLGDLISWRVSRLDAFSVSPFRT